MNHRRNLINVSVFAVVMLLVAAGLVVVFGEFRFSSSSTYHANFTTASRLKTGQDVRIAGVPVGSVSEIKLAPDNTVDVTFEVNKKYQLYTSTRALIRYENLVGDRFMEIASGPGDLRKLPPGAIVVWKASRANSAGHISIALGDGRESSDHIGRQLTRNHGAAHQVFVPVK